MASLERIVIMKSKTKRKNTAKEKGAAPFFEKPENKGSVECIIEISTFGI